MCGEQEAPLCSSQTPLGSPPRVRGTGLFQCAILVDHRITPACAGNRAFLPLPIVFHPDHPRVCGEQNAFTPTNAVFPGSPPRVRGTAVLRGLRGFGGRITPACAGNRYTIRFWQKAITDHPRVCGEQQEIEERKCQLTGSPPRVRGTARSSSCKWHSPRITPACAGNSGTTDRLSSSA